MFSPNDDTQVCSFMALERLVSYPKRGSFCHITEKNQKSQGTWKAKFCGKHVSKTKE